MNEAAFKLMYQGFAVRRFHTTFVVLTPETVGHHTAGVITMIFFLYQGKPPISAVWNALTHDVAESVTGDAPATAKWDFPKLKEAIEEAEGEVMTSAGIETVTDDRDDDLLKYADMMDLVMKASAELSSGNQFMGGILNNAVTYCAAMLEGPLADYPPAFDLWTICTGRPYARKH